MLLPWPTSRKRTLKLQVDSSAKLPADSPDFLWGFMGERYAVISENIAIIEMIIWLNVISPQMIFVQGF